MENNNYDIEITNKKEALRLSNSNIQFRIIKESMKLLKKCSRLPLKFQSINQVKILIKILINSKGNHESYRFLFY